MYDEDDYLLLSGIQHFAFCRRQWALIHIEELWVENRLTAEGRVIHEKAHDPFFTEKRGDVIVSREIAVHSGELGVSGQCDIVEFHKNDDIGVNLRGHHGKWYPIIVEYKHGKSKYNDCDRMQLTLQAMCLEEMLGCKKMEKSCLYYGETKRREYVNISDDLREKAKTMLSEMRDYYKRRYTPKVKASKSCMKCSFYEQCLPKSVNGKSASEYIKNALLECVEKG
ncbi:MAG: CRISPR-associated protein Cas4 [Eubacterium sp.]|jgi:CRISPR-associated exonuclease Cas4|nr:CRISPR-associated protein Cas4 [Eubacterium sp.]